MYMLHIIKNISVILLNIIKFFFILLHINIHLEIRTISIFSNLSLSTCFYNYLEAYWSLHHLHQISLFSLSKKKENDIRSMLQNLRSNIYCQCWKLITITIMLLQRLHSTIHYQYSLLKICSTHMLYINYIGTKVHSVFLA